VAAKPPVNEGNALRQKLALKVELAEYTKADGISLHLLFDPTQNLTLNTQNFFALCVYPCLIFLCVFVP